MNATLHVRQLRAAITGRYWDSVAHDISFDAEPGTISVIVGARGTGKTAQALAIGGLIPDPIAGAVSGTVSWSDAARSGMPGALPKPAVLSQDAVDWVVSDTVFGEIAFALENAGLPYEEIAAQVERIARQFGLSDRLASHPLHLSGGQKQRLALAAQLVSSPQVVCCDEPFRGLDHEAGAVTRSLLEQLKRAENTIIVFTNRIPAHLWAMTPDQWLFLQAGGATLFRSSADFICFMSDRPIAEQVYIEDYVTTSRTKVSGVNFPPPTTRSRNAESTREQTPLVRAKNFTAMPYRGFVLGPLSFQRKGPGVTAVLGANGSGKSSFAKTAVWRHKRLSQKGRLKLKAHGRTRVYYAAQDSTRHFSKHQCLEELYVYGLGESGATILLEKYGIGDVALRDPLTIARSKQQLLSLALAEASNAHILFLDEPSSCLDAAGVDCLVRALARLREENRRIFVITHDLQFARAVSDDVLVFTRGQITFDGALSVLPDEWRAEAVTQYPVMP